MFATSILKAYRSALLCILFPTEEVVYLFDGCLLRSSIPCQSLPHFSNRHNIVATFNHMSHLRLSPVFLSAGFHLTIGVMAPYENHDQNCSSSARRHHGHTTILSEVPDSEHTPNPNPTPSSYQKAHLLSYAIVGECQFTIPGAQALALRGSVGERSS